MAQRATTSSIDVELSQGYMRERVRAMVDTPETASSGVDVGTVTLEEVVAGTDRLNLVSIVITPWLKADTPTAVPAPLPRSYILRLKMVPHLITPATTPDAARRRELLCAPGDTACTADSGVLLTFEFHELFSRVNQEAVACASSNYDFIDAQVLGGVYESLGKQGPLLLPGGQLTSMISGIIGSPVNLIGVNVGSDLELKIGFLLDQGTPDPFDPNTALSRYPNQDWGIDIDTDFITTAVRAQAVAQATVDSRVKNVSVNVDYTSAGIDVNVAGFLDLPVCGVNFTSALTVSPQVCKNTAGTSVIQACTGQPQTNTSAGVCAAIVLSFTGGLSTAVVGSGGANSNGCSVLSEVQFGSDANDVFYATTIDTDEVFYIAGRSTFIDQIRSQSLGGARAPLPATCP